VWHTESLHDLYKDGVWYNWKRKKFPLTKDESFTRFEMEEEDKIFE
jgi:hypothetical protein